MSNSISSSVASNLTSVSRDLLLLKTKHKKSSSSSPNKKKLSSSSSSPSLNRTKKVSSGNRARKFNPTLNKLSDKTTAYLHAKAEVHRKPRVVTQRERALSLRSSIAPLIQVQKTPKTIAEAPLASYYQHLFTENDLHDVDSCTYSDVVGQVRHGGDRPYPTAKRMFYLYTPLQP